MQKVTSSNPKRDSVQVQIPSLASFQFYNIQIENKLFPSHFDPLVIISSQKEIEPGNLLITKIEFDSSKQSIFVTLKNISISSTCEGKIFLTFI